MFLRSETWGHVALCMSASPEMIAREEEGEFAMMRCRYGKQAFAAPLELLSGLAAYAHEMAHNPATVQALGEAF